MTAERKSPTAVIRIGEELHKFTESIETERFSARVSSSGERFTLTVTPLEPLEFDELSLVFTEQINDDDRIFVNGYQSWTDSFEHSLRDTVRGIRHIPDALVKKYDFDKYGDYGFVRYSGQPGNFHGFTYAYIRNGGSFRLYASLSEREGFTKFTVLGQRQRIKASRECEGAVFSDSFAAVDIALLTGSEKEVFDRWAVLYGIDPHREKLPRIHGYTSWYRHYQDISEEKLLHDLDSLTASGMPMDIFQIDDGYQTAVGDWLSIDGSKFPNGLAALAERIHSQGYKAGLWLAPFVCEKNSELFARHPDWIVKNSEGSPLAAGCNWSGSYALDIYNSEVREYLREVFDTVLNKWGFDLVKLDFLYAACILPAGGKSRGQIMCEGMDFLREITGDKLILGCGVPLGAAFGKVDLCRIGCDVGLDWNGNPVMQQTHRERVSTRNSILNTVFRRQLNGRFFGNDPDVFLLREDNISLYHCQRQSLAYMNHLFGNVLFTSDDVSTYTEKQKKLYSNAARLTEADIKSVDLTDGTVTVVLSLRGKEKTVRLSIEDGRLF